MKFEEIINFNQIFIFLLYITVYNNYDQLIVNDQNIIK